MIRAVLNSLCFFTKRFHTYMGGLTKSACTPGLTKSVKVCMYALTIAYLVSPVYLKCEDVSLFSIFYFLFSFLWAHKKHKDTNKQISDFFLLRCFLSALFIFVCYLRFCAFAWLRLYSFVLLARVKSFRKKKQKVWNFSNDPIHITTRVDAKAHIYCFYDIILLLKSVQGGEITKPERTYFIDGR